MLQEFQYLPDYGKVSFPDMQPIPLSRVIPHATPDAIHFISELLSLNPSHRLTSREVYDRSLMACLTSLLSTCCVLQAFTHDFLLDSPLSHPNLATLPIPQKRKLQRSDSQLKGVVVRELLDSYLDLGMFSSMYTFF